MSEQQNYCTTKGLGKTFAILFLIIVGVPLLMTPVLAGDKAFRKCASCHSIEEGGRNKTGPNLWNVMNRGVAADDSYKYSKALTKWAEENPEWTPELMDAWLINPKKLVKGTKMNFREKKEAKRADIIEYLQKMGVQTE